MSYYRITSYMWDNINDLINLNLHQTPYKPGCYADGYVDILYGRLSFGADTGLSARLCGRRMVKACC